MTTDPQAIGTEQALDVALRLVFGSDHPDDIETGIDALVDLATRGLPEASWRLCALYFADAIIPQDLEKAEFWLERAAFQGHEEALALNTALTERRQGWLAEQGVGSTAEVEPETYPEQRLN